MGQLRPASMDKHPIGYLMRSDEPQIHEHVSQTKQIHQARYV